METFTTFPVSLKTLLDRVETGKIQLPDFQRGWVWDDERIRSLLVSVSRGFPVGAVMTLDAGGDVRFLSRLVEGAATEDSSQPAEQYLLDGQQRLTSLYQALRHAGPVETRARPGGSKVRKRWYYVDVQGALDPSVDRDDTIVSVPENRIVKSNIGRTVELDLSSRDREFERHMIPTEKVMDGMEWGFRYAEYWQKRGGHPHGDPFAFFQRFKDDVLDSFTEYKLPVINLEKETPKEAVCTVFEKVNTGGVTLSVFELVTASFAAGDFSLRDDWEARKERLHSEFGVLQGLQGDQFLQAVTLLATQARNREAAAKDGSPNQAPGIGCKRADILNLRLDEYREWADRVEAGFRKAAKFLHGQYVFTAGNVPYGTQLVPLAALYAELGGDLATANAQEKLNHWFWCGVFGEAYGSAVETQFALDLPQVAGYVRGGPEPVLVTQANFIPERLLSLRTRNSAAYKGLYALQMKSGAADWISGEPLSLATWHGEGVDIHHVFPVAWCRSAEPPIPGVLCDSIINKTPIDAATNRKLGGQAPSRYLERLRRGIDQDRLRRVLEAHWIDRRALEQDRFGDFFVERGQAMLDLINRTMGKQALDGREAFRNALDSAGLATDRYAEDDEVEYDPIGEGAYDGEETAGAEQFYHVIDADKAPGFRSGSRTADMRQCIIDNPDGVTSAMLAEASGAPRSHCSNYLWHCMQRGWVGHRPEPEPEAGT